MIIMFKFCNECFLCKKYYNDDAKYKNAYSVKSKKKLAKFINNDYEINRSNEELTEVRSPAAMRIHAVDTIKAIIAADETNPTAEILLIISFSPISYFLLCGNFI